MKPFTNGLDSETQLLVALGSAVASGCIPCLESITGMARSEHIDEKKMPEGLKIKDIIREVILNRDQASLSGFHWKSLYIGAMHFQDSYNYDIERVKRCAIHYATPDGRIIPFCAYNAGPTYRVEVEKRFSVPLEEWRARKNK